MGKWGVLFVKFNQVSDVLFLNFNNSMVMVFLLFHFSQLPYNQLFHACVLSTFYSFKSSSGNHFSYKYRIKNK